MRGLVLAHVPIGSYSLPIPLGVIALAAVVVVAASFLGIYLLRPRPTPEDDDAGVVIPGWVITLLSLFSLAVIAFIAWVGITGRQGLAALNASSLLFFIYIIPLLPIAHVVIGGVYQISNPFAFVARLLSGGRRMQNAGEILKRLGYWPAVIGLFLLVMAESIPEIVQNPTVLGVMTLIYFGFQVFMGVLLGDEWYEGGDVFHAMTSLASTIAPLALRRDSNGRARFVGGFNPARFLPVMPGREALVTLWLAGVLADGVRATPLWKLTIAPAVTPTFEQMGKFAGVDIGAAAEVTLEIVFTWLAFAVFFWLFVLVASVFSAEVTKRDGTQRSELRRMAAIVSPSLIPIALAYLFAHNLTQIEAVGPLIITARNAAPSQLGGLIQDQIRGISTALVWWPQAGAIVIGHIIAVVMAHTRLNQASEREAPEVRHRVALNADLGWLTAMLIYTATSLWILYQPISNSGR